MNNESWLETIPVVFDFSIFLPTSDHSGPAPEPPCKVAGWVSANSFILLKISGYNIMDN